MPKKANCPGGNRAISERRYDRNLPTSIILPHPHTFVNAAKRLNDLLIRSISLDPHNIDIAMLDSLVTEADKLAEEVGHDSD